MRNRHNAHFLGMGKKARAKRTERKAERKERKGKRIARRETRADSRTARRDARTEKIKNGGGFFDKLGDAAGVFAESKLSESQYYDDEDNLGVSQDQETAQTTQATKAETNPESDNKQMYIIAGVVVVAVLIFVFKDKLFKK